MNKGLLFVIVLALIYWAVYFTANPGPPVPEERENAAVQQAVRDSNIRLLDKAVEIFRQAENRNPENLQELVEKGYVDEIPDPGDEPFEYNPRTGKVK